MKYKNFVDRGRFELPTRGSSVPCSTNWSYRSESKQFQPNCKLGITYVLVNILENCFYVVPSMESNHHTSNLIVVLLRNYYLPK